MVSTSVQNILRWFYSYRSTRNSTLSRRNLKAALAESSEAPLVQCLPNYSDNHHRGLAQNAQQRLQTAQMQFASLPDRSEADLVGFIGLLTPRTLSHSSYAVAQRVEKHLRCSDSLAQCSRQAFWSRFPSALFACPGSGHGARCTGNGASAAFSTTERSR